MGWTLGMIGVAMLFAAVAGSVAHWRENSPRSGARRRAQYAAMREALYFYADRSHWRRRHFRGRHWANPAAVTDRGARARRALDGVATEYTAKDRTFPTLPRWRP